MECRIGGALEAGARSDGLISQCSIEEKPVYEKAHRFQPDICFTGRPRPAEHAKASGCLITVRAPLWEAAS